MKVFDLSFTDPAAYANQDYDKLKSNANKLYRKKFEMVLHQKKEVSIFGYEEQLLDKAASLDAIVATSFASLLVLPTKVFVSIL